MTKDRPRSVRDLFLKEVAVLDRTVNTFMRKKLNKMKTHKWNKTIEELEEEKVAEKSSAESKTLRVKSHGGGRQLHRLWLKTQVRLIS